MASSAYEVWSLDGGKNTVLPSALKEAELVDGFQVEKVTAVGQSKSNNAWI
jgi:hypothetical protein